MKKRWRLVLSWEQSQPLEVQGQAKPAAQHLLANCKCKCKSIFLPFASEIYFCGVTHQKFLL
jgi:hypothetical protein